MALASVEMTWGFSKCINCLSASQHDFAHRKVNSLFHCYF